MNTTSYNEDKILDLDTAPILDIFYGRKQERKELNYLIFEQNRTYAI